MADFPHTPRAARGYLARSLVLLVAVAGFLGLLVPLCSDGMSGMGQSPIGVVHNGMDNASGTTRDAAADSAPISGVGWLFAAPDGKSPSGSGAILLACIVVLVGILAAVLALRRPPHGPIAARVCLLPGQSALSPALRRPSLTALCVQQV